MESACQSTAIVILWSFRSDKKLCNLAPFHVRKQVESLILSKIDYSYIVFHPLIVPTETIKIFDIVQMPWHIAK